MIARVVAAAVYGYWSAATSRPSARAASSRSIASPARPQTVFDPHLRCETCSRAPDPAARTAAIDSSSDVEQPVGLVAHVRRVEPAAPRRRGDERLDLARRRVHPGRVDQAGRQPERARIERRLDLAHHRRQLARRAGRASAPTTAPRTVPWPTRNATFGPSVCPLDVIEVLREGRPASPAAPLARNARSTSLAPGVGHRREAVAAIARQLGREPLVKVAGQGAIDEHRAVGVAMRIDEAGRDHVARDVEHLGDGRRCRPPRDRRSRRSDRRARRRRPAGVAIRCRR